MFQDEARFGRISDVRRWLGSQTYTPTCQGMLTHEYTYAFGAVDVCTGELDSLILPHVNTGCMQLFLNEVAARHPDDRIVMVIDGAGWHRSSRSRRPKTSTYSVCRPTRLNSTPSSMCGVSYARSSSITGSSKALTRLRIIWHWR